MTKTATGMPRSLSPKDRSLFVCAVLVAIVCGVYAAVWRQAPVIEGDSPQYMEVADDLSDFHLDAVHDRSPGYPLLLRLTGASRAPTRSLFLASLALHAVSVLLLAIVLRAAGATHRWLVAFSILGCLPPFAETAAVVMTENLAQFTVVLGVASLTLYVVSPPTAWLVPAALGFAYAGITRPAYQVLGLVVAFVMLVASAAPAVVFCRARLRRGAAAIVLATLGLAGGLSAYNLRHFGFFGVSPTLGFHLTTKTILFVEQAPDAFAVVRDVLVDERTRELVKRGGWHDGSQTVWSARERLHEATGLDTPRLSSLLLRMNLALIRRAPLPYLRDLAQSLGRYWLPVSGGHADFGSTMLRWTWFCLHAVLVWLLVLQGAALVGLAVTGATRWLAGDRHTPWFGVIAGNPTVTAAYLASTLVIVYTWVITCALDIGEPRQRRATDLLAVFTCVLGAHLWYRTWNRLRLSAHP